MCGITGFVNFEGLVNPDHIIKDMTDVISHRGPDNFGIYLDKKFDIALGHRRLSILDLSNDGLQPMLSSNKRFVLVFNGEIYNYLEIKKLLNSKNIALNWKGKSDTEVLLESISFFGLHETLRMARGMFAFALFDNLKKKLILVRDRMGEKPIYYGFSHNSFLFSSELKSFYKFPKFEKKISRDSLNLFFKYCYIPNSHCIYDNVFKLEASTILEIDTSSKQINKGKIRKETYWEPKLQKKYKEFSKEDFLVEIENKLSNSVNQQMRSDVPLGSFLSGGIDSSLISCLMQKNSSKKINTFNVKFEENRFDESVFARKVSDTIGSNHHEINVDYKMALETIPNLGQIYDEPFADSSQIPTFLISKEIKKSVTVALSGDGGDELFGGYNRYTSVENVNKILKLFPYNSKYFLSNLIRLFSENNWDIINKYIISKISNKYSFSNFGHKLYRLAERINRCSSKIEIYKSFLSENNSDNMIVKDSIDIDIVQQIIQNNNIIDEDFKNFMMNIDTKMYLPDDILVKVDRASMANSLESRAPFLDADLVELSFNIPSKLKIIKNDKKILLKSILEKYFEKDLFNRPKAGFAIPLAEWLRGPLKSLLYDSINNLKKTNTDILNFELIEKKCKEHSSYQKNYDNFLWSVIIYNNWYESIN